MLNMPLCDTLPLTEVFAKMPVEELEQTLNDFIAPMTDLLPEECLRRVVPEAVRGIRMPGS
jgi:hypothetical protein